MFRPVIIPDMAQERMHPPAAAVVMGLQAEGMREAIHAAPVGVRADVLCSVSPRGVHALLRSSCRDRPRMTRGARRQQRGPPSLAIPSTRRRTRDRRLPRTQRAGRFPRPPSSSS
jgi:hypothetical protein